MAQHDLGPKHEEANALFAAGRVSPTEVARLIYGERFVKSTRAQRAGLRADVKQWRNEWYKAHGLEVPVLNSRGVAMSPIPRPLPKDGSVQSRGVGSQTQFAGPAGASASATSAPDDASVRPPSPDSLDALLATLPIKLPLRVSDDDPLEERQRAFVLRASIRRMSRKDSFAAAGVRPETADAWMADITPREEGLSFAEQVEMARAIGALEHVEALAKYAAQNPYSPKGLDIRTWLLERQHQDFIRKQAQAILVGGEVFVRTAETTAPARLVQDIEAIAKRLTFNLPALPARDEVIEGIVSEVEQEREEDVDGDE